MAVRSKLEAVTSTVKSIKQPSAGRVIGPDKSAIRTRGKGGKFYDVPQAEDEAGTSAGAVKGWQTRKAGGGQQFLPFTPASTKSRVGQMHGKLKKAGYKNTGTTRDGFETYYEHPNRPGTFVKVNRHGAWTSWKGPSNYPEVGPAPKLVGRGDDTQSLTKHVKTSEGGPGSGPRPGQPHPHRGRFGAPQTISKSDLTAGGLHPSERAAAIMRREKDNVNRAIQWGTKSDIEDARARHDSVRSQINAHLKNMGIDPTAPAGKGGPTGGRTTPQPVARPHKYASEAASATTQAPVQRKGVRAEAVLPHDDQVPVESFKSDVKRKLALKSVMGKRNTEVGEWDPAKHPRGEGGRWASVSDQGSHRQGAAGGRYWISHPDPEDKEGTHKLQWERTSGRVQDLGSHPTKDAAMAAAEKHERTTLKRRSASRARDDVRRSLGLKKTPYGWESESEVKEQAVPSTATTNPLYSKEEVNYRYASDPSRSCGVCKHYIEPGLCELVAGMIRPVDVCDKFEPKEQVEEAMKEQGWEPAKGDRASEGGEAGTSSGAAKGWQTRRLGWKPPVKSGKYAPPAEPHPSFWKGTRPGRISPTGRAAGQVPMARQSEAVEGGPGSGPRPGYRHGGVAPKLKPVGKWPTKPKKGPYLPWRYKSSEGLTRLRQHGIVVRPAEGGAKMAVRSEAVEFPKRLAGEAGDKPHHVSFPSTKKTVRFAKHAEVTPPGGEDVVRALKKKPGIENPWAVAWSMKKKGYISDRMDESWPDVGDDKYTQNVSGIQKVHGPVESEAVEFPKRLR